MSSYAYVEDGKVTIGNDYIERIFSVDNNRLLTKEIRNKRIPGDKSIIFKNYSAEFFVAFKIKKFLGDSTAFLSSNNLELDKVNIFKRRVEFVFKPYSFNGAKITFIESVEIEDNNHYMHKYIEMVVAPEEQHLLTVDYIDCEHIIIDTPEQQWTIGEIDSAYLSPYHSALGQPVYVNGMFIGSEFPMAENNIQNNTVYSRYFSGKRFDNLPLNCGHTFKTWNVVIGAARGIDTDDIRSDFLEYIRNISRKIKPRFQYNSWYDHMHNITNENIIASFREIEDNLSKTMVPPLDSYVVDDGFVNWDNDFWSFNSKFPDELYPAASCARKFSSHFGLWNGPRGGYNNKTPIFAKRMEKAGKGGYNRASGDVCVSSSEYIKNISEYYLENDKKFDINYWKLDGFLLRACPSKKHGHITGGYNQMYQYTEMWENWINIFRRLRITRESAGKDLWINQTSYCNASPWFLQWSDSLWMQNSSDIGFTDKTDVGEALGDRDVDRVLTYRDGRYYDFCVTRNYQFPCEYIYNHDPIYGNTAKISMTDDEFRKYLFMISTRGNALWELYYSYNMFNKAKWRINSDALRFVRKNFKTLRNSKLIGGSPTNGEVYGYSAWSVKDGIISLRNPSAKRQSFVLTLDKKIGAPENIFGLKKAMIYPFSVETGNEYKYGDNVIFNLEPFETVVVKFSTETDSSPSLIYSRFEHSNELLMFFDDRIYTDLSYISCDAKINSIEILEDYSTLKIIFESPVQNVFISMSVRNEFGSLTDIQFSGKYSNNISAENSVSRLRDISVSLVLSDIGNGTVLRLGDAVTLSISEGYGAVKFGNKASRGDIAVNKGDKITLVLEPNGLAKLYVNAELSSSAYCENPEKYNMPFSFECSDSVTDFEIIDRALSFKEIL